MIGCTGARVSGNILPVCAGGQYPAGVFRGNRGGIPAGNSFKGGNYLDAITKINTVVFDKTGTLTKGVFEVQQDTSGRVLPKRRLCGQLPLSRAGAITR